MKDEIIKNEVEIEPVKVNPKHQNPKHDIVNDKIEQWYLSTFYNRQIDTQLFNHFIKSKDALKASLLELF